MADAKTDFNENIPAKIRADVEAAKAVGGIFLFRISGDAGGTWTLNLKDDVGVQEGEHGEPDVTLALSDETWAIVSEDFDGQAMALFMQQKIAATGNIPLAMKLKDVLG